MGCLGKNYRRAAYLIQPAKTAVVEVRVGRMEEGNLDNTHERPFGLVITVYIWNEKQNSNKGVQCGLEE